MPDVFTDVYLQIERLEDGVWKRLSSGEHIDSGGKATRRLARVPELKALDSRAPSYAVTLRELQTADWSQSEHRDGLIRYRAEEDPTPWLGAPGETFLEWMHNDPPRAPRAHWDAAGGSEWQVMDDEARDAVARLGAEEAEKALLADAPEGYRLMVCVTWYSTYAESNRGFLEFLDAHVAPLGAPDHVRVVFEN